MEIDPALISIILTIISLFSLVSRVKRLITIGKWILLLTLIYAVIFVPAVKDFFVVVFDMLKNALNNIFGGTH